MSRPRSRISELLELHVLEREPTFIRMRIFKAMEQYGKEQYSEGYNEPYIDDARLRSLVQAQKELIGLLDISIVRGFLLEESLKKVKELRNQIKELEK